MFQYLRESDSCQIDPKTGDDIQQLQDINGIMFYANNADGLLNINGTIEGYELDFAFDHVNIQDRYLKDFILDYLDSLDSNGKDGFIEVDGLAEIERSFLEDGRVKQDFMELIDTKIQDYKQRLVEIEKLMSEREAEINKIREDASLRGEHQLPARMEAVSFDMIIEQRDSKKYLSLLEKFQQSLLSI